MNEQFFHKIRLVSQKFSVAKGQRIKYENMRKIIKSQLMIDAKESGHKTVNSQENYAYTHEKYLNVCQELSDNVALESLLWWELKSYEMEMDYWRTQQSTRRAEMQLM
jgi:hypothetical protein